MVVNCVKSDWDPIWSGVPQTILYTLYNNDIIVNIDSKLGLFADDYICFREIKDSENTVKVGAGDSNQSNAILCRLQGNGLRK